MTLCNTAKSSSEILTGYWHRSVLHFAAVPRIIGKKILRGVIEMKFNVLRSKISAPTVFVSVFPF